MQLEKKSKESNLTNITFQNDVTQDEVCLCYTLFGLRELFRFKSRLVCVKLVI